jgi:hypothetical protein
MSIKFYFRKQEYYALARLREKEAEPAYYITVMNGDLERLLYGNHILVPKDGRFYSDLPSDTELGSLKCVIAEALNKQLALASVPGKFC